MSNYKDQIEELHKSLLKQNQTILSLESRIAKAHNELAI